MSQVNDSPEREFEAVNSRLSEGLKTCRSVVSNYKALLSSEQSATEPAEKAADETSIILSAER